MTNDKLKIIMTDLAAGHISKKEAEYLINEEKTRQVKPVQGFEGNPGKDEPKNAHKRKKQLNVREVK
jgi:hypothetical protein